MDGRFTVSCGKLYHKEVQEIIMLFMGCDVGKTGGVVVVEDGAILYLGRFAQKPPVFHVPEIAQVLSGQPITAWLEEVEGWPNESVKSIFTFGRHAGKADSMFELLGIQPTLVRPKDWQKAIGWRPSYKLSSTASKHKIKKLRKNWIWTRMQEVYNVSLNKDVADAVGLCYAASLTQGL